jgi:hypothetical protein
MKNIPRNRTQDLREAVASIISMMLGLLRAQGLRGLLHLPEIVMVVFLLRSIGNRFAALMDAYAAGALPLATPAPDITLPVGQPACAQAATTPRVRARPATPRHRGPHQPAPAKIARAGSTRVHPPADRSRKPLGRVPAPVPQKNSVSAVLPSHDYFVTISQHNSEPVGNPFNSAIDLRQFPGAHSPGMPSRNQPA